MNLHDELERLAQQAPPATSPDTVLRRARRVRQRRAVAIPTAAIVAVVLITLTAWTWTRSRQSEPADHPVTLTFHVTSSADAQTVEKTRRVLESRARALGLVRPHATVQGGDIVLDVALPPSETARAALTAPGHFETRLVIRVASISAPASTSSAAPVSSQPASTLDGLIAKLGTAYTVAQTLPWPDGTDPRLEPFRALTPGEVALLPPLIQFNVAFIDCGQLNARPVPPAAADGQATVCEGQVKLLVDRVVLTGADVSEASVVPEPTGQAVSVSFTATSAAKWTALTRDAAHGNGCDPGEGPHCRIAFIVDGRSVTSPEILNPLSTTVELRTGSENTDWALAAQIGTLELPASLVQVS